MLELIILGMLSGCFGDVGVLAEFQGSDILARNRIFFIKATESQHFGLRFEVFKL